MVCTLTPSARRMDFHYQKASIPWAFPCFHLETIEFKTLEGSFRLHLFKISAASILNLSFKCKLVWKDQVDEGEKGSDVIFLSQPCIRQLFKLISNPSPKRRTYSLFFLFSLLRMQYLANHEANLTVLSFVKLRKPHQYACCLLSTSWKLPATECLSMTVSRQFLNSMLISFQRLHLKSTIINIIFWERRVFN